MKNDKIKVLFLASWYPSRDHPVNGIFIRRHALAVSKFCEVAVLYVHMAQGADGMDVTRFEGIPEIRVYKKNRKFKNRLMRSLYDNFLFYVDYLAAGYQGYRIAVKELGEPDLIHANVILHSGLLALAIKLAKGTPYLLTEHWAGYLDVVGTFYKRSAIGRSMIRAVGRHAIAITTVSFFLRDAMIRCGINNRYFIVPNVIDMSSYQQRFETAGKKRILHISLLKDDVKNVSGIIDALKVLSEKRSDFELHIVGDGPDRLRLEELAKSYGLLNDLVYFDGMANEKEVEHFIRGSHFTVINSNYETFCVAAAESMACGKPVIATTCGGPEEFIDERCGILVKPKDEAGLITAIDWMLDNCSRYNSEEIAKLSSGKFSSEAVGASFYDIYRKVLSKG